MFEGEDSKEERGVHPSSFNITLLPSFPSFPLLFLSFSFFFVERKEIVKNVDFTFDFVWFLLRRFKLRQWGYEELYDHLVAVGVNSLEAFLNLPSFAPSLTVQFFFFFFFWFLDNWCFVFFFFFLWKVEEHMMYDLFARVSSKWECSFLFKLLFHRLFFLLLLHEILGFFETELRKTFLELPDAALIE